MTLKQFNVVRAVIAMTLSALIAIAITSEMFFLAFAAVISAVLLMFVIKKQVREVIVDERDYEIAGKSARWALSVFSTLAAAITFFLLYFRATNPYYEVIGSTLAYSVCFLLILYSLIFKCYERPEGKHRKGYIIAIIIVTFLITVAGVRLFSGEDNWVCKDGEWVKHGEPSFPAPAVSCAQ